MMKAAKVLQDAVIEFAAHVGGDLGSGCVEGVAAGHRLTVLTKGAQVLVEERESLRFVRLANLRGTWYPYQCDQVGMAVIGGVFRCDGIGVIYPMQAKCAEIANSFGEEILGWLLPPKPVAMKKPKTSPAPKLIALAEAMQAAIDKKRAPKLENTRRRARMADSARRDAEDMELVRDGLNALAKAWNDGNVPELLTCVTSRALVEDIFHHERYSYLTDAGKKRLKKAGIFDTIAIDVSSKALMALIQQGKDAPKHDPKADQIAVLEREARFSQIAGYFPTPKPLVKKMIELAELRPGLRVLEPSAGNGNIADAVRETGADVDVIEISPMLVKILNLKDFKVVASDFTRYEPEQKYDRVLMNPPFEAGQDMEHVRRAYQLTRPDGKVVAIMGRGAFFRSDKKAIEFREWLGGIDHHVEELPDGSFKESGTGVAANLVVLERAA